MALQQKNILTRIPAERACLIWAVGFACLYLVAWIWPEPWWGIHYLAFLPPVAAISVVLAAIGVGLGWVYGSPFQEALIKERTGRWKQYVPLGISLFMGILFFAFPIPFDRYGDAPYWYVFADKIAEKYQSEWLPLIFSLDIFHPKVGQRTLLNSFSLLSWMTGLKVGMIIRIIEAICGGLFVFLWLKMVRKYIAGQVTRIAIAVVGITSPFLLNYFGHIELYGPVITAQIAFGSALFAYFQKPQNRQLIILVLLCLLNMKLHTSAFIMLFLVGIIGLFHMIPSWNIQDLTTRKIIRYILYPIITLGIILYVFILEDFKDSRIIFPGMDVSERFFLPLFSPEPPLERYNLQSFNHLFDYLQSLLVGPNSAILILLAAGLLFRKKINWTTPLVLLTALTYFLYAGLFFMINPLVGMPFDWDLFTLPTVPFLLFTLAVLSQVQTDRVGKILLGPILAIGLLNSACFILHQNEVALGKRYISMGKHTFKTYWVRAGEDVDYGINLLKKTQSKEEILHHLLRSVDGLEEMASPGNDREYAEMIKEVGKHYLREMNQIDTAILYLEKAKSYAPEHTPVLIILVEAYFLGKKFDKALGETDVLVRKKKPTELRALKIAIHCSLEAQAYDKALTYADSFMQINQEDEVVREVFQRLTQRDRVGELKMLFRRR